MDDNKIKELADKISKYLSECELVKTSWQYPAIIGMMKDYYITARPATPKEELSHESLTLLSANMNGDDEKAEKLYEQIIANRQYEKVVEQIWLRKPSQLEINAGIQPELLDEAVNILLDLIKKEKEKINGTN